MKKIDKTLIRKALDILVMEEIIVLSRKENHSLPTIDKSFLSVCSGFFHVAYSLGLEQAALYYEKNPEGQAVEKNRYAFCQALLNFIAPESKERLLIQYIQNHKGNDKLQFEMIEAAEYLKLAMSVAKTKMSIAL